jgi:large subunit ribosomal protein L25
VDIQNLALDEMLNLSDIKVPEGVEILQLVQGEEYDQGIVSIHVIKVAVIEEEVVEGEEAAEGEELAEGEAPAAEDGGDADSGSDKEEKGD